MNKKSHAASLAISAILFVAFFPPITNATGPSQVTKSHICKAGVATVMGRDPSIMRIDTEVGGVLYLSYVRADDGSLWSYKCTVDGNLIIWASDTGRWRNHPADPRLSSESRQKPFMLRRSTAMVRPPRNPSNWTS